MSILTPQNLLDFFNDDARVADEVTRICALLTERRAGTALPKNYNGRVFSVRMPENFCASFIAKVVAKFVDAGWEAKLEDRHDITGEHSALVLSSPVLSALPSAPSEGGRR